MEADLKGYVVGSGPDPRSPQDVSISAGATGVLNLAVFTPGIIPSLNTPYDLTSTPLTFTVTNAAGATVYTATVALNSPATLGTGIVSLAPSATSGLGPTTGYAPVTYTHVTTTQSGYQIYPPSRFTVGPSEGSPNPPPSPPGPQGPQGPAGTPPTYTRTTLDGTSSVLCSYTLAPSSLLRVQLVVNGKISPRQSDGGVGELGLVAYFESDANGVVTQLGQDAQASGTLSASYAALSPQPALSTRIAGSRVDVLIAGSGSTTINWTCVDTLTLPPPAGAGAGSVGPAGAAGPVGPPGQAPAYSLTTTDGTTVGTFATYAMASSSLLIVRLRISAAIIPNPGDGGAGEYTVESWFVTDGSGVVTKITEDIQRGAASPTFSALSPTVATSISGSNVLVQITGVAATTIKWAATDTLTVPTPPGAQGPIGPQGIQGPVGPAGVPADLLVTTVDANPTLLATYPVAVSGYRLIELRIISRDATDAALAVVYFNAYATANGAGTITIQQQDATVVPKTANWPTGTNAIAQVVGSNIQVLVTGAVGKTITWECVDWSTTPPLSVPAPQWPAAPAYNCDAVVRSGVFKYRQHERAEVIFAGTENPPQLAASWPDFQSRAYEVRAAAPIPSDGQGVVTPLLSSVTSTGCTVQVPDGFAGKVDIDIAEVIS